MINALASDVAVTWLGAAGCIAYCRFLLRNGQPGAVRRATLFLVGLLSLLLTLRGFYWLWPTAALGRAVFAVATLLPLAISIFIEHLLRRHHPLWLKLTSAAVCVSFFGLNAIANLAVHRTLLLAFLAGFALVVAANAWLLARVREQDLSRNEWQVARALLFAAVLTVPLVISDFRTLLPWIPVRLGALSALMYVYILLSLIEAERVALALLARLIAAIAIASIVALIFGAVIGPPSQLQTAMLSGLPVATACTVLAAILARMITIASSHDGQRFLRWLMHARLDSVEGFVHSLKRLSLTTEHAVLGPEQLARYSLDALFEPAGSRRGPISLSEARAWSSHPGQRIAAAEQLVDLLERHEMTHALLISRAPALIVLLNLPEGPHAVLGHLRAGVIQRLARRLAAAGPVQ